MNGPTIDDIRAWPATVDVATASRAIGVSRSYGYELARRGAFPVKCLPVGGKTRVLTSDLMHVLGITPERSEAAHGRAASAHDVPDKDNDDAPQNATPGRPLRAVQPAG